MKKQFLYLSILFWVLGLTETVAQQHISLSSYSGQPQIKATGSVTLTDGFQIPYGNNVRVFTGASFQLCNPLTSSPSTGQNYVLSRVFKIAGVNSSNINASRSVCEENQTIQYIDGLGRPLQAVTVQGSPSFADVVQPIAYDALGREAVKYQPYTVAGNNGTYRANAITEQLGFYNSPTLDPSIKATSQPFSQTVFEASPLNRVLEQGAPGAPWQPYNAAIANSGHTVKPGYLINDATDAVKLWTINASGAATAANYLPGRLYKTVSKDENWTSGRAGTAEEFKDLEGRVVLKKVWETESVALSTQYLYDDMGSLRYVLPPAVTANSFTEADAVFKNYIYGYHYDGRKRIIEKKIPGKGWEHLVYNKLDQVVLTQDSVQRTNGKWLFTKYDALGRTVITGLLGSSSTRAMWQTGMDGQTVFWEARDDANAGASGTGYTNVASPSTDITSCLTISYYDDYNFLGNSFGAPAGVQAGGGRTRGLPTGTKINIPSTGAMLLTVTYYDDEGRAIQTKSQNHLTGTDVVDNSYNFAGELVASTRTHTASPSGTPTTIATRYEYDHMGRKLATMEEINSQGEVTSAKLDYNELGQLKQKNLHSTDGTSFLQSTTFAYNERGWMKNSVSDQFSMQLKYEDGTVPQFNGNISGQLWGAGSSLPNTFAYAYDRLNRLVNGSTTAGVAMGETLTYDAMGNIATLSRFDGSVTKTGTYNYTGNQLTGITGGTLATGAYAYDGNGNATTDGRNGVGLTYNYLNLPVSAIKSGLNLSYVYDATGAKLKKISTATSTATTDYVGGIQYNNGTIDFIQTEEGIARNGGGNYSYEYSLTDHLSNVRYTFNRHPVTGQLQPLQAEDYYAFGMRRVVAAGDNRYLYNGKELQEELDQYDYGARFYDPVIARWNVIDAKSELYFQIAPYAYAANTPANAIDPDGHIVIFINGNHIDGSGGSPEYWRAYSRVKVGFKEVPGRYGESYQQPIYAMKETGAFDRLAMNKFNDHNESLRGRPFNPYIDGSETGKAPNDGSLILKSRVDAGYEKGVQDAAMLINSLARTNGVITESLKIVSHSMGGAFAKGYIRAIVEYAIAHPSLAKGLSITEYDFASFQQNKQSAVPGTTLYQFDNQGDQVVGGAVGRALGSKHAKEGGREEDGSNDNVNPSGGHAIMDFIKAIPTLKEGRYKLVNGKFVRQ